MMGVCRKAQTEIKESKGTSDTSQQLMTSFKNSDPKSSMILYDCNSEVVLTNKIRNNNIPQKIHNVEERIEESFGKMSSS